MDEDFDDLAWPGLADDADLSAVRELFARARRAGTDEELDDEPEVLAAMAAALARPAVVDLDAARTSRRGRKAGIRVAIVAGSLFVGTSAAAATGSLPDAAQSAVARATSHIGLRLDDPKQAEPDSAPTSTATSIVATSAPAATAATSLETVPSPDTVPSSVPVPSTVPVAADPPSVSAALPEPSTVDTDGVATSPGDAATPAAPVGPDAAGPAKHGLCTAWAAKDPGNPSLDGSVAMQNLRDAAAAAGQTIEQYCAEFVPPPTTEPPGPPAVAAPPEPPGKPDVPGPPDGTRPAPPGKSNGAGHGGNGRD